jgi:cellulose biosynthesis protein BcsQ
MYDSILLELKIMSDNTITPIEVEYETLSDLHSKIEEIKRKRYNILNDLDSMIRINLDQFRSRFNRSQIDYSRMELYLPKYEIRINSDNLDHVVFKFSYRAEMISSMSISNLSTNNISSKEFEAMVKYFKEVAAAVNKSLEKYEKDQLEENILKYHTILETLQ